MRSHTCASVLTFMVNFFRMMDLTSSLELVPDGIQAIQGSPKSEISLPFPAGLGNALNLTITFSGCDVFGAVSESRK